MASLKRVNVAIFADQHLMRGDQMILRHPKIVCAPKSHAFIFTTGSIHTVYLLIHQPSAQSLDDQFAITHKD